MKGRRRSGGIPNGFAGGFLGLVADAAPGSPRQRPPDSTTLPRRFPARFVPALGDCVRLPAGSYSLGDDGAERTANLRSVLIGRWPITNAHMRRFVKETGIPASGMLAAKLADQQLDDHPVTDLSFADAEAFCAWATVTLGCPVRLPTGDEWEALARGSDRRWWPWGDVFDSDRCDSAEAAWGWTVPVSAHPHGAGPFGAEQLAGNIWEWVTDIADKGSWRQLRGGSYLDAAWGVRAARALPADPDRATATTGFRIAIELGDGEDGQ